MSGYSGNQNLPRQGFLMRGFVSTILLTVGLIAVSFGYRTAGSAIRGEKVVDIAAIPTGWADESRCADCHEQQPDAVLQPGQARTLAPASDPDSLRVLRRLEASSIGRTEKVHVEVVDDQIYVVNRSGEVTITVKLDWCFGSGTHARTWVSTLPDSFNATNLLELRWTWYHSLSDFDVTPGQPEVAGRTAVGQMGLLFDGPRAWRCFDCHSTRLSLNDGRIEESHIQAGVTCQRCHGPRQSHVASEGEWHDPLWAVADRDDAVGRCAECHRSVEEQRAHEIRQDNPDIVRFQPVGLSQSACFTKSQMSCTTCHDPHRPMGEQDSKGIWQCLQCHNSDQPDHVLCGKGMRDRCLGCHMPPVKTEVPVAFTDHWIRVRDESEQP
jgi:hypothetical protein